MQAQTAQPAQNERKIELNASGYFPAWLREQNISLGVTTYQTNRLFLIGMKPDGRLSTFERNFDRPMGLFTSQDRLYLSTRTQIWQFDNALSEGELYKETYNKLFVPRKSHTTGELDTHDVALDKDGDLVFVNTRYCCLAKLSDQHSFRPIWKPPFISKLAPQDRCHLNGLAMVDGEPAFVTAVSKSDVPNGWRDRRHNGGVVVNVKTNEIICEGLSMPHSPRVYRDKLWVLNSGTGDFGYVDQEAKKFVPVTFCPGFMRGLAFHDKYAIVGLSGPRHDKTFGGLDVERRLAEKDADPKCGLLVIDIESGDIVHWFNFDGGLITELFDVQVLAGVSCPASLGFKTTEINRIISFPNEDGLVAFNIMPESDKDKQASPNVAPDLALGTGQNRTQQQADGTGQVNVNDITLNQIQFQLTDKISAQQMAQQFDKLTFPSIQRQLYATRLNEPLVTAVALYNRQPVGAAIAEIFPDGRGKVISYFVAHQLRGKGIGKKLLETLESGLKQKRAKVMVMRYRSDWKSVTTLESFVPKMGFTDPKTILLLCKTGKNISQAPWFDKMSLPSGFESFNWELLSKEEKTYILNRKEKEDWYPKALDPFQLENRIYYPASVGLRYQDKVVGWVVTHQISEDTIQYTTLFVSPEMQRMGRAIALLVEAIRRQINIFDQTGKVPYGAFQVEVQNDLMRKFVERRMKPYLSTYTEERVMR
ncbi:MAG: TIGR03032 family protein, partial [Bacteroidota bacterium]